MLRTFIADWNAALRTVMMLLEHEDEFVVTKGAHFIIFTSDTCLFMHQGKIVEAGNRLQVWIQEGRFLRGVNCLVRITISPTAPSFLLLNHALSSRGTLSTIPRIPLTAPSSWSWLCVSLVIRDVCRQSHVLCLVLCFLWWLNIEAMWRRDQGHTLIAYSIALSLLYAF